MKKLIKLITLLLIAVMLLSATACSLLFSSSSNDGEYTNPSTEPKTQTITVYKDETPYTYTVTCGETAKVDVFTKLGYYFEGAYDKITEGTKYFDTTGCSLVKWEETFPVTFYAKMEDIHNLKCEFNIFGNEPKSGGTNGERTSKVVLKPEFISAIKGNFDKELKVEYSVDLKTASGYDYAHPIGFYVKGYDNSGADKHTIFTHTPKVGDFSTFKGSAEINANDFVDGNVYVCLWNTKKYMMAWAYPVFYSRNLSISISFA